jgi:hypothetical protein
MKIFFALNSVTLENSNNEYFTIESFVDFLMNYGSILDILEIHSLNSYNLLGTMISFKC